MVQSTGVVGRKEEEDGNNRSAFLLLRHRDFVASIALSFRYPLCRPPVRHKGISLSLFFLLPILVFFSETLLSPLLCDTDNHEFRRQSLFLSFFLWYLFLLYIYVRRTSNCGKHFAIILLQTLYVAYLLFLLFINILRTMLRLIL